MNLLIAKTESEKGTGRYCIQEYIHWYIYKPAIAPDYSIPKVSYK